MLFLSCMKGRMGPVLVSDAHVEVPIENLKVFRFCSFIFATFAEYVCPVVRQQEIASGLKYLTRHRCRYRKAKSSVKRIYFFHFAAIPTIPTTNYGMLALFRGHRESKRVCRRSRFSRKSALLSHSDLCPVHALILLFPYLDLHYWSPRSRPTRYASS